MSLVSSQFNVGKLNGTVYDFGMGDVLPMHSHTDGNVHISIVLRGSFKATGPYADGTSWEKILEQGKIYDWNADQFHEFTALEPNSRVINIIK
ncbi:MAG: hypothetical protein WCH96_08920 [Betaproteobacteria bacterium]